jgi:hypothetical protein
MIRCVRPCIRSRLVFQTGEDRERRGRAWVHVHSPCSRPSSAILKCMRVFRKPACLLLAFVGCERLQRHTFCFALRLERDVCRPSYRERDCLHYSGKGCVHVETLLAASDLLGHLLARWVSVAGDGCAAPLLEILLQETKDGVFL